MSRDRLYQSIYSAIASAALVVARYVPVWMVLLASLPVRAQQLSARCYDVSDGLAHGDVSAIHQDRKGYLWFGTWEGLSRFDGYRFTNYGVRDGLGHPIINDIVEDRRGRLWFATNGGGGVFLLIDDPQEAASFHQTGTALAERRRFISFQVGDSPESNLVSAMLFDQADNLWLSTDDGVYRAAMSTDRRLQFNLVAPTRPTDYARVALADRRGRFWFGIKNELIQIVRDRIIKYGPEDGVGRRRIKNVVEDRRGRVLAANEREVFEFVEPPNGNMDGDVDGYARGSWRRLPLILRPDQFIYAMLSDSSGALWIGTSTGLIKYRDGKQTLYTDAQGLSGGVIRTLMEDRDGNLWIGASKRGVCKLSDELIVSFTKTEGLPGQSVARVIEDRQGRIYASFDSGGLVEIVEGRAVPIPEAPLPSELSDSPFVALFPFQDSRGDWWTPAHEGLFLSEGPGLQFRRGRKLSQVDGIPANKLNTAAIVAEDPFGKLWVLCRVNTLFRLDLPTLAQYRARKQAAVPSNSRLLTRAVLNEGRRGRAVFEHVRLNPALPGNVLWMKSDRAGTLWLGGHGVLAHLREGKVIVLAPTDGLPETNPRAFFQDSRGWVWIGLRYKGVSVTRDPTAENPEFINYSTRTGLTSDTVWSITEDNAGRIYLGTGKGLDRLDPMTGRIRHFNVKDGLAGAVINHCIKDRNGNIWVATGGGLSKFDPRAERIADRPPPIYFSRVQVAGEDLPLAETGALSIPEIELPSSRNNLLIEYVALSFQGEQRLRYQYKLEGVDGDWSQPAEARSVNYARLAPGSYQFMARTINQDGVMSLEPALFRFRIMPPLWQRWWFLALAAILTGAAAYALYRYRVTRLVELERVRTRIATDLHDDIGANLTRIAILSEVAQQRLGGESQPDGAPFPSIARIARESVASMSDIVWTINPKRDSLRDLSRRMRGFASEVFTSRNIEFRFHAPDPEQDLKIGPDVRRAVYLIFKEAVNNIVRHSGCARAEIELRMDGAYLALRVSDDGRGFDPRQQGEGNGLESMKRRAQSVHAELEALSQAGRGTVIALRVPAGRRVWTKPALKSLKRPT